MNMTLCKWKALDILLFKSCNQQLSDALYNFLPTFSSLMLEHKFITNYVHQKSFSSSSSLGTHSINKGTIHTYIIVSRSQPLPLWNGLVNCKYSSRSENYWKSGSQYMVLRGRRANTHFKITDSTEAQC